MTSMYYSDMEKNLYCGFGSAFLAFGIFAAVLFNAERLPDALVLAGIIATNVLAWVGVICLHKATFGRQY